jgi:hypothetical protein
MTRFAAIVAITAVVIAAGALAVEQLDDRDTFVPPPDAVAEQFVRELMTKRWERARTFLDRELSDQELEELQRSLEERVGEPTEIEAEEVSRGDDRALVNVRLSSAKGSEAVAYNLTFDDGWTIAMP